MTSKVRHLHQDARGRYHARMGVPIELRKTIGKRELIKALGGDRQVALRALPAVVAGFQKTLEAARQQSTNAQGDVRTGSARLTADEIAVIHFNEKLVQDDQLRDAAPGYARINIDDGYVADVRSIYSGSAISELIEQIFGTELRIYRQRGYHAWAPGSTEWRRLAARLALSELEVLKRMFERDEGRFVTDPPDWVKEHEPEPVSAPDAQESTVCSEHTLFELFEMCRRAKTGSKELTDRTSKAYLKPINDFISYLGSDDPTKVTNRKVSKWIEHLQFDLGLAPKTIKARYLPAVKHTLRWAGNQGHIEPITLTASVAVPRKRHDREKIVSREVV